ncbi:hypothetical protein SAMN05421881_11351 [Nitrosomonas halophila]|uniref:Uncharacterized protein n=1 Tax=Nitrosomonas halophila TaxID=44576 RepID=A0A1H3Q6V9_9PROT|nr:hypothetical protein SAMN05421881_11351 [Nitrosomonas halophila]
MDVVLDEIIKSDIPFQPLHSPDGKKHDGSDAASLGGPLVMQVVSASSRTAALFYIFCEPGFDKGLIRHVTFVCFDFDAIKQ